MPVSDLSWRCHGKLNQTLSDISTTNSAPSQDRSFERAMCKTHDILMEEWLWAGLGAQAPRPKSTLYEYQRPNR